MKTTIKFSFIFLILSIASYIAYSQDTTANRFGKGIKIIAKDSSFSLNFGMRFQTLMTIESPINREINYYDDTETHFMIRRSRLKFDGFAYSPKLHYKIELGLSASDLSGANDFTEHSPLLILDAVARWNFYGNFELWVGQTKLPGNRERVISSQKLQFVDRSIVNGRFNIDRDAGLQLNHHFNINNVVVREVASISMGEGRDVVVENQGGLDYTARVEVLPLGEFTKGGDYIGSDIYREETPKLSIGFSYDYNDNAKRQRGQLGSIMDEERDLQSIIADMMFKYRGFSVMSEYIRKTTPTTPLVYNDEGVETGAFYTGDGFVIQGGYLFKNNFEIAARYAIVKPEQVTGRDNIEQYTLGVSRYIVGHNLKVQSDVTYTLNGKEFPDLMYRLQLEVAF